MAPESGLARGADTASPNNAGDTPETKIWPRTQAEVSCILRSIHQALNPETFDPYSLSAPESLKLHHSCREKRPQIQSSLIPKP